MKKIENGYSDLLLGMHTYTLHLHGMGQNWGGTELDWEQVWDIFGLIDLAVELELDGLHLTAVDLGSTEPGHLIKVRDAAEKAGLYLEYNFSLDGSGYDDRLTNTIEEAIAICANLGSDIAKISMDVHRQKPVTGSLFSPDIIPQLEDIAKKCSVAAPVAEKNGIYLCLENHTETFADEVIWTINAANHSHVAGCVDTNNSLMIGENPLEAIRKLAPYSRTNHFSDHRIEFEQFGCRITGVACGTGDVPIREALACISANPHMKRINFEVEFDPGIMRKDQARQAEMQAAIDSIQFIRSELGVGRKSGK